MTTGNSRADALTGQHVHALTMAQIASCTCLTKTPDPQYHDATCRYRLLAEVIDVIEHRSLQPAVAPSGYCERTGGCVCGGDLPRVREGCSEWVKSNAAPSPADERAAQELLPINRRWVVTKAVSLVAEYRNCKASETEEAMHTFVAYMRAALADAAARAASASETGAEGFTYATKQATACAGCGEHKHTPLRIDWMGGYVCLTCIDRELESRSPAMAAEVTPPSGYAYRYSHPGGVAVRFNNGGEVNGSRPIEAVPYWFAAPQPAQADARAGLTDARIARLRAAIEGECDGLTVDYHHARAILAYLDDDRA